MFMLRYGGGWVETSHRHPEAFTKLAPQGLQDQCAWNPLWHCNLWDTSIYGYPRFRLALLDSRYTIGGGMMVTIKTPEGGVRQTTPNEVFYPLYLVPKPYMGTYVLEMWRPPAWFYEQGFASPKAFEHDAVGRAWRNVEPVWPEGGWVGIWKAPESPLVFTRDVSTDLIRWALYVVHLRFDSTAEENTEAQRQRDQNEEAAQFNQTLELLRSRRPTMPGPMVNVPATIN